MVVHVVVEQAGAYDRWQKQARSGGVGLKYYRWDYREVYTGVVYQLLKSTIRIVQSRENITTLFM